MKSKSKIWIPFSVIIFINLLFFSYSVNIRKPWFGVLAGDANDPTGRHQWLTGSTLVFVKNWIIEGPGKLKFSLLQNPLSIETVNNRAPYGSYPPGVIIPIYLISKISKIHPSPSLVMGYNLFAHFAISLSLSIITYYTLKRLKVDEAQSTIASTFPPIIQFLLPHPLYYHQNSFFSDQAVLLPYVLYIFLEIIRYDSKLKKYSKKIRIIQLFINLWGLLTDWLFIFVNLFTFIKRILQKQISIKPAKKFFKQSFLFWIPSIGVIILFLTQIFSIGAFEIMKRRLILRAGLDPKSSHYHKVFFEYIYNHLLTGFGRYSPYLISLSVLAVILWIFVAKKTNLSISKNQKNIFSTLILLVMFTPVVQILVFNNHSTIHNFSVLKFSVFISLIPFTLIPIMFVKLLESSTLNEISLFTKNHKNKIYPIILILLFTYCARTHQRFMYLFPQPNYLMENVGTFINKNTTYKDIIFSPDIIVKENPPQMLSYTMKRVYEATSSAEIIKITKPIKDDYNIVILEEVSIKNEPEEIKKIKNLSNNVIENINAKLYFINKEDFVKYLETK